jgi:hypothetical protein
MIEDLDADQWAEVAAHRLGNLGSPIMNNDFEILVDIITKAMTQARSEGAAFEREACALLVEDIWSAIESEVRCGWADEGDVAATFEGLPGSIRARTEGENNND